MEFQLAVVVLNFLCLVTLRIEQGETKKEWNGKVQIGAGGDSETERDRIKDWGWRRNGSGRVGRRQKGKGGGHEAAVEKGAVEVVCLGIEWLLTQSRVVSDRDLRHRPPGRRSQAADMNPKNISIVSLPILRVKHMRRRWNENLNGWMTRNLLNGWKTLNKHERKCEVATCGRGQPMLLILDPTKAGEIFGSLFPIISARASKIWFAFMNFVLQFWR